MDAPTIVAALESHRLRFGHGYGLWRVGITDDPGRRKQEHQRPPCWLALPTDTEQTARGVEQFFIDLGMDGGTGGGSGRYVYIY